MDRRRWPCRRRCSTKTRPDSPACSSSNSSADRSASRKYSHHTAFSSRRCQSRMFANIQRPCCSSFRSAGSAGTSAVNLPISALILISQSVIFSFGAPSPGCGRGTSTPSAISCARCVSSQSRKPGRSGNHPCCRHAPRPSYSSEIEATSSSSRLAWKFGERDIRISEGGLALEAVERLQAA